MAPKVIVLILSYNGKDLLEEALNSYLNNDYSNYQVAVIDNGSTDGTQQYISATWPKVKILRTEKNLGYAGGLNFGLKYAFDQQKADYALTTNNDVRADQSLIGELVKVAEKDRTIGFTIGMTYHYDRPGVLQSVGRSEHPITWKSFHLGYNEIDRGQYNKVEERPFCDDIHWLIRRELYEKTGGYDPNFRFQAEDFDWQVRAKKAGYKIMFTPLAKIWHKGSVTIGKDSPFKAYYDFRNPTIVIMKYQDNHFFRRYFHYTMKNLFVSSLKNTVKLRWYYVYKQWRGLFSALVWGLKNHCLSIKHFV